MAKEDDYYDMINDNGNELSCLKCNKKGMRVTFDTVLSLCNDFIKTTINYAHYYLCTNKKCDVAYFSDTRTILTSEIKHPIWFKENSNKFIICYCRQITLNDIVEAIEKIDGEITIEKVVRVLGKENDPKNCLLEFPTGEECTTLFLNAIEYGKKIISKK